MPNETPKSPLFRAVELLFEALSADERGRLRSLLLARYAAALRCATAEVIRERPAKEIPETPRDGERRPRNVFG